jgi:hypothetical protein
MRPRADCTPNADEGTEIDEAAATDAGSLGQPRSSEGGTLSREVIGEGMQDDGRHAISDSTVCPESLLCVVPVPLLRWAGGRPSFPFRCSSWPVLSCPAVLLSHTRDDS